MANARRCFWRLSLQVLAAPVDIGDCFRIIPEIFNIADRFQCSGHRSMRALAVRKVGLASTLKDLDFAPVIDRGELITTASSGQIAGGVCYKRYEITMESGISPRKQSRAFLVSTHTAASDEHDRRWRPDPAMSSPTRQSVAP